MNGVGDRRRLMGPPQRSQVVRAGSEMRCLTSKTRGHLGHSYSYVGTNLRVNMSEMSVSRRGRLLCLWALLTVVGLAGCRSSKEQQVQRLQARATYEQGLSHLKEGRVSLALASLQEAVRLDPGAALYHNT